MKMGPEFIHQIDESLITCLAFSDADLIALKVLLGAILDNLGASLDPRELKFKEIGLDIYERLSVILDLGFQEENNKLKIHQPGTE